MTRVATPDTEEALLSVALHSTAAQLEHTCRLLRRVQAVDAPPQRDRDRRWVSERSTGDGMVSIQLRLRPEEAALVMRAIDDHRPAAGERADGVVALAEAVVAGCRDREPKGSSGNAASAGCDTGSKETRSRGDAVATRGGAGTTEACSRGGAGRACSDAQATEACSRGGAGRACSGAQAAENHPRRDAPAPASTPARVMAPATDVMITIDAATLTGETSLGDGVPVETCRRILCDAGVVPAITDETGSTLDIGRKTRVIPASIRRALHRRDNGCRFPGCDARHVDGHHIEHWLDDGETKLDNLISLCRFHHTRLHDGEVSLAIERGDFVFRDKWGRTLENAPSRPVGDAEQLRGNALAAGLEIDSATQSPGWDGSPPDYPWIVHGLCN